MEACKLCNKIALPRIIYFMLIPLFLNLTVNIANIGKLWQSIIIKIMLHSYIFASHFILYTYTVQEKKQILYVNLP